MSDISKKFAQLKKEGNKALVIFIEAGDPSLAVTEKLVYEIEKSGADIIELGIPFSDSIADGPTIQAAANRALAKNTSAKDILALVSKMRKRSSVPIVLMTSFNIVFKYGVSKFVEDAARSKVSGFIVPDLPPEEAGELTKLAKQKGIDVIFLVAPNTPNDRIKKIADASSGFIYLISITGITGARESVSSGVAGAVSRIRKATDKPIAVGFGISKASQVRDISKVSDGVIVGSAVVNIIAKNGKSKTLPKKVGAFVKSLKKGLS
ncbi:tryptophan synthase subunit alpha [Candidatus Margulisiibacteriota bacterium]